MDAKLQHPLAVQYNSHNGLVYVADSYNHKVWTLLECFSSLNQISLILPLNNVVVQKLMNYINFLI